jgi:transposase-like protein
MVHIGSLMKHEYGLPAVEPIHRQILGVYISRHRNMIIAKSFLISLIKIYGKHIVYCDRGTWYGMQKHMYLIRTKT